MSGGRSPELLSSFLLILLSLLAQAATFTPYNSHRQGRKKENIVEFPLWPEKLQGRSVSRDWGLDPDMSFPNAVHNCCTFPIAAAGNKWSWPVSWGIAFAATGVIWFHSMSGDFRRAILAVVWRPELPMIGWNFHRTSTDQQEDCKAGQTCGLLGGATCSVKCCISWYMVFPAGVSLLVMDRASSLAVCGPQGCFLFLVVPSGFPVLVNSFPISRKAFKSNNSWIN